MNYLNLQQAFPFSRVRHLLCAAFSILVLLTATLGLHAQCNFVEERLIPASYGANGYFGGAVDIEGNVAAVSHGSQAGPYHIDGGLVSVFRNNGTAWVLEQELVASDQGPYDGFGYSIAISGNSMAITSINSPTGAIIGGGAVYIFQWNGTEWQEVQKLIPSDVVDVLSFGTSLALEGGKLIVAAPFKQPSVPSVDSFGQAYYFHYDGNQWVQEQLITAPSAAFLDYFGCKLAMHKDQLVLSRRSSVGGHVQSYLVYRLVGAEWILEQLISRTDFPGAVAFGDHLAIQNDTLALSIIYPDLPNSNFRDFKVHIFNKNNGVWLQQQVLDNPLPSSGFLGLGWSMAFHGDALVVGTMELNHTGYAAGAAYVYKKKWS